MKQAKYDIFISYRRKDETGKEWGTQNARNIVQALENRGYRGRVFFDHDKIGPEDFEEKILGAIKESQLFICILTKNAMDNCVNDNDWVRREIHQAIKSGLKIIFLNPDNEFNHNLLPSNFPKELKIVRTQNSIEIRSGQKFKIDIDDLVKNHISKIVPRKDNPSPLPTPIMGTLRIRTDMDCHIFNYGKKIGVAKTGEYTTLELPLGDNDMKFTGLECDKDFQTTVVSIKENHICLVEVKLLDKYKARKKRERQATEETKRKAHLLTLSDDDFDDFIEGGKWGYKLKSTQEVVIAAKYDTVYNFCENRAQVELNGKYGFIDKAGNEVVPLKYDNAWNFCGGRAYVKLNEKYGYVDQNGKEITPLKYDEVWHYDFQEERAQVKVNNKYGFINQDGKEITPLKYDNVYDFCNGYARVFFKGKYGLINKDGKEICPLKYDNVCDFCEGLAQVKLNDKWGYINKAGKEVIPPKYDSTGNFSNGKARVRVGGILFGERFTIDKNGNIVE